MQCIRIHPNFNCGNTVPSWPLSTAGVQLLGSKWAFIPTLTVKAFAASPGWTEPGRRHQLETRQTQFPISLPSCCASPIGQCLRERAGLCYPGGFHRPRMPCLEARREPNPAQSSPRSKVPAPPRLVASIATLLEAHCHNSTKQGLTFHNNPWLSTVTHCGDSLK